MGSRDKTVYRREILGGVVAHLLGGYYAGKATAERLGVSSSLVSKWSTGRTGLTIDRLYDIAEADNLSPALILRAAEFAEVELVGQDYTVTPGPLPRGKGEHVREYWGDHNVRDATRKALEVARRELDPKLYPRAARAS